MIAPNTKAVLMHNGETNKALKPWFQVHPDRFIADRDGLEAHDFILDTEKLASEDVVAYTGFLPDYPDRKLTIVFPAGYPSIPPQVVDDGNCAPLPRHQRLSCRSYCLFGPNNESWSSARFAVDVLEETRNVIDFALKKPQQHEDRVPEPFSAQAAFGNLGTVMIPPGISEMLPEDVHTIARGMFTIVKQNGNARGLVTKAEFTASGQKYEANEGYMRIAPKAVSSKGMLFFLPKLDQPILNGEDLITIFEKFNLPTKISLGWCAIIFPEQYGTSDSFRYSWLIFKYKGQNYTPVHTITYRPSEHGARIPGLGFLAEKKIGFIGCGSIGSKIASALAAAGSGGFVFIDKEAMEPANSIRHECGVNYFGISKAHALETHLSMSFPELAQKSHCFPDNPFGIDNIKRNQIVRSLQECDLIVDATGNQLLSRAISEQAAYINRPVVTVSVTNGAWTGEIFRYIPGKTACWICHQSVIDNPPPGKPAPEGVYGPGCDQPTFTGTGHELSIVAGLATSFIIDTLGVVDGSKSEYEGDYLLWEGRDSDGKLLQRSSVHRVNPRESCWLCQTQE